jgi:hypothetical protein
MRLMGWARFVRTRNRGGRRGEPTIAAAAAKAEGRIMPNVNMSRLAIAAALALAPVLTPIATTAAIAQQAPATPPAAPATPPAAPTAPQAAPATPGAPTADFTDEKLRSFAMAFIEVDKVNRTFSEQVEAAPSDTEKQELREEAGRKMVEAVEGTDGITAEEYGSIMNAAQADPELVARIQTMIGEAAQQPQ